MSDLLEDDWIPTTGGPHLLVPEEYLPAWRGIEGWSGEIGNPDDTSDYSRICQIKNFSTPIPCGEGMALALVGEVGDIGWVAGNGDQEGLLVEWISGDDSESVVADARSPDALAALDDGSAEVAQFSTGPSGVLWLMDSTSIGEEAGGDSDPRAELNWRPGTYEIRSAYFENDRSGLILRRVSFQKPVTQ